MGERDGDNRVAKCFVRKFRTEKGPVTLLLTLVEGDLSMLAEEAVYAFIVAPATAEGGRVVVRLTESSHREAPEARGLNADQVLLGM